MKVWNCTAFTCRFIGPCCDESSLSISVLADCYILRHRASSTDTIDHLKPYEALLPNILSHKVQDRPISVWVRVLLWPESV